MSDFDDMCTDSVLKASYFNSNSFWSWVEGMEFRTVPVTGLQIRCIKGGGGDLVEDAVRQGCPQCKRLWDTSKLKDSLQEVNWEEDLLDSKDSRLTLLLLGCEAAKMYAFMDGISKVLSIRMLDLIFSHTLCQPHVKTFLLAAPSSMSEVGSLHVKVVLSKAERLECVELRGRPDIAILSAFKTIPRVPRVCVLIGENKSTIEGVDQLLFCLLLTQLRNIQDRLFLQTIGVYMSPNKLQMVKVEPHMEEGPCGGGSRVCMLTFSMYQEQKIEEGGWSLF